MGLKLPDQVLADWSSIQRNFEFLSKLFPLTQDKLGTDSVGAAQIQPNAVGTSEIADGSVTPIKLGAALTLADSMDSPDYTVTTTLTTIPGLSITTAEAGTYLVFTTIRVNVSVVGAGLINLVTFAGAAQQNNHWMSGAVVTDEFRQTLVYASVAAGVAFTVKANKTVGAGTVNIGNAFTAINAIKVAG